MMKKHIYVKKLYFTPESNEQVEILLQKTGLQNFKQLCNSALTLYSKLAEAVLAGKTVILLPSEENATEAPVEIDLSGLVPALLSKSNILQNEDIWDEFIENVEDKEL